MDTVLQSCYRKIWIQLAGQNQWHLGNMSSQKPWQRPTPAQGMQAVQGVEEYQDIRDILAMLETWQPGPTLSTATHD